MNFLFKESKSKKKNFFFLGGGGGGGGGVGVGGELSGGVWAGLSNFFLL